MREYVSFYVDIAKSLQKLKIEFLRYELVVESVRKFYLRRTRTKNSIDREKLFFITF